jgi:AcrR family transcriptional regulator
VPYRRTSAVQTRLDSRRAALLDAAVALLREHGYAGCTVAAVAARAGIAAGSVYQHFGSKSELAVELFRSVVEREVAAVAAVAAAPGPLAERVVGVVETFAGRALKSPRLAYALLAEPVDAAVDTERLVFRRAFRDVFAGLVAEGVASGELPPQDPDIAGAALVGAVAEALVGPLTDAGTGPDVVPGLVAFTVRALGKDNRATDA